MVDVQSFRYDGKRVLVVGGATGMGAAAAQTAAALGAEVVVMDRAGVDYPVAQWIEVDLADRSQIDKALSEIVGPIDAVFAAAGIASGPVVRVNFIAHRHIIESMIASESIAPGAGVCLISSIAGLGWQNHLETLVEFLETPDYDSADAWITGHEGTNTYMFSKQAMNAYVAREAYPLIGKGIRINAICPGPTDTPLARAEGWLEGFGADYREITGIAALRPEQMASTMAFLNSRAASGISGVNLMVDHGHIESSIGGSFEPGKAVVDFLMTEVSV